MENRSDAVAYASWSHPAFPCSISYSLAALHEIDFLVSEGFRRIPYGGVEHGGLLFGRQENGTIQIEAFRQIDCEHASGPSFSLSQADLEAVRQQLNSFHADPELATLSALGLFVSHSRRELQVTAHEQELLSDLFAAPPQLLLLVKPEKFKATRFAFGLRTGDSLINTELTPQSFVLPLPGRGDRKIREAASQNAAPASSPATDLSKAAVSVPESMITEIPAQDDSKDPKPKRKRARRMEPRQTAAPEIEQTAEIEEANETAVPLRTPELLPLSTPQFKSGTEELGVAPDQNRATQRQHRMQAAAGLAVAILSLLACFTWFAWNYLQAPIELHATPAQGGLLIRWPAAQTSGASQAQLRVSAKDITPRMLQLSVPEKNAGRTVVAVHAGDVTVELSVHRWLHDRKGIVRVISQP